VENGAIDSVKAFCSDFGKEFLVVADEITKNLGAEKIASELNSPIIVIKDSTMGEVKRVEEIKSDCIISFGGGKVIDVGKLAAHNKKIPFISFPTSCSHDGIASMNASIWENGEYRSFPATGPSGIIADIEIISKSPYRIIASGSADLISNYCSVFDWKLASLKNGEKYSEPIALLALSAAELVSNSQEEIKKMSESGIRNLIWGLIFSGFSMTLHGSSRPASGAEHMFSHALDKLGKFGLHGEQVGIGSIFFSYLQGQDWMKIKTVLENLGAPIKLSQIGVSQDIFIEAVLKAKDVRKRYTVLDEKRLDRKSIIEISKSVSII